MSLKKDIGWIKTAELLHYGVKGMKWGVRRSSPRTEVVVTQKRKKLKAKGGKGLPASEDAVRTKSIAQVKKKSGTVALSNNDLKNYANRLQLEQNVKRLEYEQKSGAKKAVAKILGNAGKQAAQEAANKAASKQVKKLMNEEKDKS